MTEAVHEYHQGDQNISEQVATFELFGKMMKWGSLSIAVLLLMLVMWFCVGAGFFAGLFAGKACVWRAGRDAGSGNIFSHSPFSAARPAA